MTNSSIHPTAVIADGVQIGPNCEIGPYCIFESDVVIGAGNKFLANVYVGRYTQMGDNNIVFPYTTLGLQPQDLKFEDGLTRLVIGDRNTIREHVTLHRGTGHGGGVTLVGDDNLFMVGAHAGHDCQLGSRGIYAHGCALAGHVTVGNDATVGASSSVHQFCHVADYGWIGGHSVVVQDAIPYTKTVGNRAKIYGINSIGLERSGFSKQEITDLKQAYRILFLKKLRLVDALETLDRDYAGNKRVEYMVSFIRAALEQRGITR